MQLNLSELSVEQLKDLHASLSYGIMANEPLCQEIMNEMIERRIKNHPYAFTYLENDGRWETYYIDPSTGKRRAVRAKTREELIEKLKVKYFKIIKTEDITLERVGEVWMAHRKATVSNPNTVQRDMDHFNRYFKGQPFFKKNIASIRRPELKEFCCRVIKGETMRDRTRGGSKYEGAPITRHEWGNVKAMLNGMFSLAVDREWIQTNPLMGMKFDAGLFRQVKRKEKDVSVYNDDEKADLENWCIQQFQETRDVAFLVPIFLSQTGVRVGECVALQWSDLHDERRLDIERIEFKDKTTKEIKIVDHTKTFVSRTIILRLETVELLNLIREVTGNGKWIFSRDGIRLTERQANYVLEKYSASKGKKTKFSHTLRKTCGSDMRKAGFSARQCADYLGNSERVFLDHYSFDTDTDEAFAKKLDAMGKRPA